MKHIENSPFSELNGSEPCKIHIWEFPKQFRVQLEPNMAKDLIDAAAKKVRGITQLIRVLKKGGTVYSYRSSEVFIPISSLLQLCDLAGTEFAIEQVEPHIVAYKGGTKGKHIQNPNLPLVETPALFALMGHLTGDGGHSKYAASYSNTNETLIRNFISLLLTVFGTVPYRVVTAEKEAPNKTLISVWFGITVVRLLKYLYQADFKTYTAKLPKRLFNLPREYASAYLRAFGDDEGNVVDGQIRVCSASKQLMQNIYALIQAKFPELGEFSVFEEQSSESYPISVDLYYVRFRTGAFKPYRALIGFNHPVKRQELDLILARRERGWETRTDGTTRRMLLQTLSSTPMTAKTLAEQLVITQSTVRQRHLKGDTGLITLGFVRVQERTGVNGAEIFEITELGRKFLQSPVMKLLRFWRGRQTIVKILKILMNAEEGLTATELMQQVSIKGSILVRHLNGIRRYGVWKSGLIELGLVERTGEGVKTNPYLYILTDEGRRVVEELKTSFPKLCNPMTGT